MFYDRITYTYHPLNIGLSSAEILYQFVDNKILIIDMFFMRVIF